jgi:RimJ/RimL family protein N-acetyltransferase
VEQKRAGIVRPMIFALRRASADDCVLLYDFVNRADSLYEKLRTVGPIPWEVHKEWFNRRLHDPDCRIWILLVDGREQGQLRFTRGPAGWEVDIYVVEASRGLGVARETIRQAIQEMKDEAGQVRIIARVKQHNVASRHLFERLGFALQSEEPDHLIYVIDI